MESKEGVDKEFNVAPMVVRVMAYVTLLLFLSEIIWSKFLGSISRSNMATCVLIVYVVIGKEYVKLMGVTCDSMFL